MPPITPEPTHIIHSWWVMTPAVEMTSPPHQHSAATTPALRGPTRSNQPPHSAADDPSSTKNSVYIQPRLETRQSQEVVKSSWRSVISGQATLLSMPTARDSGSQN